MIAPPRGVLPTTPCVLRTTKTRPRIHVTMPDGTRKKQLEYRAVYAAVHGWEALGGRDIEHACDNGNCVRYGHLRLGDAKGNAEDKVLKGRHSNGRDRWTHCAKGHEFTDDTTYVFADGRRACKICKREDNRRRWAER